MASSDKQDTPGAPHGAGDAEVEAAARAVEVAAGGGASDVGVVTPAGEMFPSRPDDAIVSDPGDEDGEPTAVHLGIPPLLTDGDPPVDDAPHAVAASVPTTQADADAAVEADDAESPTTVGAPASKERIADAAAAARERVSEGAAGARERAAEGAAHAREKSGEAAAQAREKGAEVASVAKEKTTKARKRFSAAASEAKERASSAASDARERASNTDVKEFAHSTTSLIDTARPFFLAGAAAIFAVLGFLEGDSAVAQVFAIGALLFVIGAAFSGEINAFLSSRSQKRPPRAGDDD